MNNIWTAITTIFGGKGGAIKLAIAGSLLAGTIYEILDARYNFSFTNKDTTVSLTPTGEMPQQTAQPDTQGDAAELQAVDGETPPEPQLA